MDLFDLLFGILTLVLATYAFAHTERAKGRTATILLALMGVLEIAASVYR